MKTRHNMSKKRMRGMLKNIAYDRMKVLCDKGECHWIEVAAHNNFKIYRLAK